MLLMAFISCLIFSAELLLLLLLDFLFGFLAFDSKNFCLNTLVSCICCTLI